MSARDGMLCQLDGRGYVLDLDKFAFATVDPTRPGVDQGPGAGANSLSNEVVWRRVRGSWIGGAGQEFADLVDEEDPSSELRFHTSSAIDCWTRRELSLSRPRVSVRDRTDTGGLHRTYPVNYTGGGGLWVVDGNTIAVIWVDPRDGTTGAVASATAAADVVDAASFGDDVLYFSTATAMYTATLSGSTVTIAAFGAESPTMLAACGSRLVAADGAEIFELAADGSKTAIYTHPNDAFEWEGGVAAPNGVYVWGSVNGTSRMFLLPLADETGALEAPIPAADLPVGERVTAGVMLVGTIVLGTTTGVRLATINGDGSLTIGPDIEQIGTVRSLASAGRFVYVASDESPHIWRVDPGRFTEALLPAFAAEADHVVNLTAGLDAEPSWVSVTVRDATASAPAAAAVVVVGTDTVTVYVDAYGGTDQVAPSGEVDLGWFTFGIGETLAFDSLTVECDRNAAGDASAVTAYVDTPDEDDVASFTAVVADTPEFTIRLPEDLRSSRFRVRLALTGDTTLGTSPTVREVTLRAIPAPAMSDQMLLPILLHDSVETEHGQVSGQHVWEEWEAIREMRDSRRPVSLRLGSWEGTVRVESLEVRSGGLGDGNGLIGWDRLDEWMQGLWIVRVVTLP